MTRPRTKTPGANRSTQKSSRRYPFLKLPAELRNKTYRLALTTESRVYVNKDTFNIRKALVDTCTKTRKETREIFHAENHFLIVMDGFAVWRAAVWLVSLGTTGRMINGLDLAVNFSRDGEKKIRKRDELASYGAAALEVAFTMPSGEGARRCPLGGHPFSFECLSPCLGTSPPTYGKIGPPQWDNDVVLMKGALGLAFEADSCRRR